MGTDISGSWEKNSETAGKRSLLSKALRQFAVSVAVCFGLTVPLFYLLTKHFYAEDMVDVIEAVERGASIPPLDLERDIVAGMMLQFLLIFLVISLSFFVTMHFATKRLWKPFDDTLRKAERFNLAQDDVPEFTATDTWEFVRLNRTLERLMRKDKESFRIQKEFTENASHELQTPLAVIRGKLDLLLQGSLTERQMGLVSDIDALTMRMGRLNNNLLLLAKIDNAQYADMEDTDLAAALSDSLPLYDAMLDGRILRVTDRRSVPHAMLRANSALLECLLKNLIVNAIRYSMSGEEVEILIEDGRLTVGNKSVDGLPLDATMLFCRFRPGEVRRKGNGLGLAIVKAVCDLHGWRVEYAFEGGRHLFVVRFG